MFTAALTSVALPAYSGLANAIGYNFGIFFIDDFYCWAL